MPAAGKTTPTSKSIIFKTRLLCFFLVIFCLQYEYLFPAFLVSSALSDVRDRSGFGFISGSGSGLFVDNRRGGGR